MGCKKSEEVTDRGIGATGTTRRCGARELFHKVRYTPNSHQSSVPSPVHGGRRSWL